MKIFIIIISVLFVLTPSYASSLLNFAHYNSRVYGSAESILVEKNDLNNLDIFPASLATLDHPALSIGYLKWSDWLSIMRLAYAQNLSSFGVLGGSVNLASLKEVNNYDRYGNLLGHVKNSDVLINLGLGKDLSFLATGINLKYLNMNLDENNKNFLGLGVSVLLPLNFKGINIDKKHNFKAGISLQNLGLLKLDHDTSYPLSFYGGFSYEFLKISDILIKIGSTFTHITKYSHNYISAGYELNYNDLLFFRNGFYLLKRDIDRMAFGVGIRADQRLKKDFLKDTIFEIDYSVSLLEEGLSHFVQLGILFIPPGKIKEKDFELSEEQDAIFFTINNKGKPLYDDIHSLLTPKGKQVLDEFLGHLDQEYKRIVIKVNLDEIGTRKANFTLPDKLKAEMGTYLINNGVVKEKITFKAFGRLLSVNQKEEEGISDLRYKIVVQLWEEGEKEKFDSHFYNGLDAFLKEGYDKALDEWEQALMIDPENEDLKDRIEQVKKLGGIHDKSVRAYIDMPEKISKKYKNFIVIILPYENTGDSEKWALLKRTIPDSVGSSLDNYSYIKVIGRGVLEEYMLKKEWEEKDLADEYLKIAQELRTDIVITGSFIQTGRRLEIKTTLYDTQTGSAFSKIRVVGEVGVNMFDYMDKTVKSIIKVLKEHKE
ncbi:MAG: hypothetical protein JW827_05885 [Spirochaetes bacterium]|nr:hypothetical protein [Spirochaetota bacterium]